MRTLSLHEHRIFWREFRQNFHTTGAILPSSRWLAAALARYVGQGAAPQRILEVGPGTGVVTRKIISRLRPDDRLDLVELNSQFVALLQRRFEEDPRFKAAAAQTAVFHCGVEELAIDQPYDLVISGLPLNNFEVPQVASILSAFGRLLRPGGTLSFFEYIGVRPARAVVSGREQRERLRGISLLLRPVFESGEIRRDWIWANVPPAWVHHVRLSPSHLTASQSVGMQS